MSANGRNMMCTARNRYHHRGWGERSCRVGSKRARQVKLPLLVDLKRQVDIGLQALQFRDATQGTVKPALQQRVLLS